MARPFGVQFQWPASVHDVRISRGSRKEQFRMLIWSVASSRKTKFDQANEQLQYFETNSGGIRDSARFG
jgi:hypothetical protein